MLKVSPGCPQPSNQPTHQSINQSQLRIVKPKQNKPVNKQVKQIKQAKLKPYQGK